MKTKLFASSAIALSLAASAAVAQPGTQGVKATANQLSGSDTLDTLITFVLSELVAGSKISNGDIIYNAQGSGTGQNQLEGGKTTAGEPTCTPTSGQNMGCQEVAPMSRPMNSGICDDQESGGAEMLAICRDYIVVFSDNLGAYSNPGPGGSCNAASTTNPVNNDAAKLGGTGKVLSTGYAIGANGMEPWKDVLRLVYTGCQNTDSGTACAVAGNRASRCANANRAALVANWDALLEGAACPTGACPGGLRRAYRRDDASGTTAVFLGFLGVPVGSNNANLAHRSTSWTGLVPASAAMTGASNDHAFCDGGDIEGFQRDTAGTLTNAAYGDPIRTNCTAEEDLCGADGKLALVRAIRSVPTGAITAAEAYPTRMCTPNVFRRGVFASGAPATGPGGGALPVCPDGQSAGSCFVPVDTASPFSATNPNFNCWNRATNVRSGSGVTDGRVYNAYEHKANELLARRSGTTTNVIDIAQWREQMVRTFPTGIVVTNPTMTLECTETDATSNIGCIVGKTRCTIGWAGEEAVRLAYANTNEPFLIDSSATGPSGANARDLERQLFLSSIGGFENTVANCQARDGMSSPFCNAQKELVNYFLDTTVGTDGLTNTARACGRGGFDVLPAGPACLAGTATITGFPGCGSADGVCAAN